MARPSPLVPYIYWQTVIGLESKYAAKCAKRAAALYCTEHVPPAHTRTNEITLLVVAGGGIRRHRGPRGQQQSAIAPSCQSAVCSSCSDFHAQCDRSTTTTHHLFTPGLTSRADHDPHRTARRYTSLFSPVP